MDASKLSEDAAREISRAICVRWRDPSEELLGLARVAHALIDRGECKPSDVCFAVPNLNWGMQMRRACSAAKLSSTLCMASPRISREAQDALAALDVLSDPASLEARSAYASFGHTDAETDALVAKFASLHGFTLIKLLGIDRIADFDHARYHVTGVEAPADLAETLRRRIEHPLIPPHVEVAPIIGMRDVAAAGSFAWVFLVGCVSGLVPASAACGEPSAEARNEAERLWREAFVGSIGASSRTAVVSYFERVDASIADAARIRYARCKMEHGRKLAMCAPTEFLAQAGAARPTTVGGQAFLRDFDLN